MLPFCSPLGPNPDINAVTDIIKTLHYNTSDSILDTAIYNPGQLTLFGIYIFCAVGVLREVIDKCVAGASVVDLCEFGDRRITEETSKVYKKEKEMKKGMGC